MSLNINVIKDKILSENWFLLRNMTYELTPVSYTHLTLPTICSV